MRESNDEKRWFYGDQEHETERAFLVRYEQTGDNNTGTIWLPKSQVQHLGTNKWLVPQWLLEKNGLMIYSEPVEHDGMIDDSEMPF